MNDTNPRELVEEIRAKMDSKYDRWNQSSGDMLNDVDLMLDCYDALAAENAKLNAEIEEAKKLIDRLFGCAAFSACDMCDFDLREFFRPRKRRCEGK